MRAVLLPMAAFAAGLISFCSPCCLPLIPGYLSYVSALPIADLGHAEARRVTLRAALLFSAGFTVVFTVLGVASGLLGATLLRRLPALVRVGGFLIVILGLVTLGVIRIPVMSREKRFDLAKVPIEHSCSSLTFESDCPARSTPLGLFWRLRRRCLRALLSA